MNCPRSVLFSAHEPVGGHSHMHKQTPDPTALGRWDETKTKPGPQIQDRDKKHDSMGLNSIAHRAANPGTPIKLFPFFLGPSGPRHAVAYYQPVSWKLIIHIQETCNSRRPFRWFHLCLQASGHIYWQHRARTSRGFQASAAPGCAPGLLRFVPSRHSCNATAP